MDAANRERLPEAHSELVKLLSEKELKDASLLILANKQVSRFFYSVFGSVVDPDPH
jgi:hypothetical protein